MLLCLPKYKDYVVVRSRDPDVLKLCGTVVDVGAVYDPSKNMFDHHQRTFAASNVFPGHNIKLSSAGLVYKHFGATESGGRVLGLYWDCIGIVLNVY